MKASPSVKVSPRWLSALVFTSLLAVVPGLLHAEAIALVTDVTGKAAIQGRGAISILSEIEPDARVQLDASAKLVAIYLKSGEEYILTGPAEIRFQADGPQVLSGVKPQRRKSALLKGGQDVTIRLGNVTQAGFVMRGGRATGRIKLLSLSGTKTLAAAPEFRWQEIEPGISYRFELIDNTGKLLFNTKAVSGSLTLPASVRLREGIVYTWEVSTRLADGRRYVGTADFTLAPPALKDRVEALRPAATSTVSERVTFAAWLEQMELRDEARKYWRALAQERPEDGRLKMLSAE